MTTTAGELRPVDIGRPIELDYTDPYDPYSRQVHIHPVRLGDHPESEPTMSIVEFLLARIAEDEAAAQGAGRIAWITIRDREGRMVYTTVASQTLGSDPDWWVADGRGLGTPSGSPVTTDAMDVLVVFDEVRALAECEAKRRIVGIHAELGDRICAECWDDKPGSWPCHSLQLLALLCADHPDYDPRWRP